MFVVVCLTHDAVMASGFAVIAGIHHAGFGHQAKVRRRLGDGADVFVDKRNQSTITSNNVAKEFLIEVLVKTIHPWQVLHGRTLGLIRFARFDRNWHLVR